MGILFKGSAYTGGTGTTEIRVYYMSELRLSDRVCILCLVMRI